MVKGAAFEHVNLRYSTPLTALWSNMQVPFSRKDFLLAMLPFSPLVLFPEDNDFVNPLSQVAMHGKVEDVELLLKLGANLHALDNNGDRIIISSLQGSNLETFDFLASFMPECWIHEKDGRGMTPLHRVMRAPRAYSSKIVERLITMGIDIHARDSEGRSAFDHAKTTDEFNNELRSEGCSRLHGLLNVMRSLGYDVDVDEEGDVFWSSKSFT